MCICTHTYTHPKLVTGQCLREGNIHLWAQMYATEGFRIKCRLVGALGKGTRGIFFYFSVILHSHDIAIVIKSSRNCSSCPRFCSASLSFRLSQNLDGVVIELLFRQSKISEVLGGSGYNSDRLCLPYIPQLTGMSSGQSLPPTSAFPAR